MIRYLIIISIAFALLSLTHASIPKETISVPVTKLDTIKFNGEDYKLKSSNPSEIGTQEVFEGPKAFITRISGTSNPKYEVAGAAKIEGAKLFWQSDESLGFQYDVKGRKVLEIWLFSDNQTLAYTEITDQLPKKEDLEKIVTNLSSLKNNL